MTKITRIIVKINVIDQSAISINVYIIKIEKSSVNNISILFDKVLMWRDSPLINPIISPEFFWTYIVYGIERKALNIFLEK